MKQHNNQNARIKEIYKTQQPKARGGGYCYYIKLEGMSKQIKCDKSQYDEAFGLINNLVDVVYYFLSGNPNLAYLVSIKPAQPRPEIQPSADLFTS